MGHIPYGYRIKNGKAVIDEAAATQVRELYKNYLSGLSLTNAAKEAGLDLLHSGAKRMMRNSHYLGDDFYPAIIDRETFEAFAAERDRREKALGRDNRESKPVTASPAPTVFRMRKKDQTLSNPYRQAEYIYSLIESEE